MVVSFASHALRNALYFDSPLEFCRFVQKCGAHAGTARKLELALYRVAHPRRPGECALVLFGYARRLFDGGESIQARAEGNHLKWNLSDQNPVVLERRCACSLIEFVALVPWNEEQENTISKDSVLFRIARGNADVAGSAIRSSLKLGNDRIHFANLTSSSDSALLLRIEKPSWFLLLQLLEDHPEVLQAYYPAANRISGARGSLAIRG